MHVDKSMVVYLRHYEI